MNKIVAARPWPIEQKTRVNELWIFSCSKAKILALLQRNSLSKENSRKQLATKLQLEVFNLRTSLEFICLDKNLFTLTAKILSEINMTETAGIHFGPAWLRETLVHPPHGLEPNSGGGGGGGSKMASNPNIMAPAKLAEFRYGREEMLALFTMPGEKALPGFQERVVANAGLLAEKPLWPMNLMGPMSEDEQRAWQKGANSDTSLRLYKKELPPGSLGAGGPGIGRGGGGERGRGRGRGFFDRHRAPGDEEDPGRREEGGRGFGRGKNKKNRQSLFTF